MSRAVATIGMFDGVHLGHQSLLRSLVTVARTRNERSLVITFSNHPLSVVRPDAAPRLLCTPEQKRKLLFDAGVDTISILEFTSRLRAMTAREYIRSLREEYGVDVIILGFNNSFGSDRGLSFDDYVEIGKSEGVAFIRENELIMDGETVNSTGIRRMLEVGDVEKAARFLGREYEVCGSVVYGKQLGRTIGFPTANIEIDSGNKLVPCNGVYACRATLHGGMMLPAMVNIGHRPTVDSADSKISIEAHIIGLSDKLYGEKISLSFCHFLRHEQKFNSLTALQSQLEEDKVRTINLFSPGGL